MAISKRTFEADSARPERVITQPTKARARIRIKQGAIGEKSSPEYFVSRPYAKDGDSTWPQILYGDPPNIRRSCRSVKVSL